MKTHLTISLGDAGVDFDFDFDQVTLPVNRLLYICFCCFCCSSPDAVDTPSTRRCTARLFRNLRMFYGGSPEFTKLLDTRRRTNDSRVTQISYREHHRISYLQNSHATYHLEHSSKRLRLLQMRRKKSERRNGRFNSSLQ